MTLLTRYLIALPMIIIPIPAWCLAQAWWADNMCPFAPETYVDFFWGTMAFIIVALIAAATVAVGATMLIEQPRH